MIGKLHLRTAVHPSSPLATALDIRHYTMSLVLPSDIIALIINIVGENKDTNLLKELALPVVSFLPPDL